MKTYVSYVGFSEHLNAKPLSAHSQSDGLSRDAWVTRPYRRLNCHRGRICRALAGYVGVCTRTAPPWGSEVSSSVML